MTKTLAEWIEERREIERKATPGPWEWIGNDLDGPCPVTVLCVQDLPENAYSESQSGRLCMDNEDGDRALIADARNHYAAMLDLIRAQAEVIEYGGKPSGPGLGFGSKPINVSKWKPAHVALDAIRTRMGIET